MMTWIQQLPELSTAAVVMLKMTVLLCGGWILHFAFARRNPRWRVLVWRGVMLGMVLLPVGEVLLPKLQVPVAPPLPIEELVTPLVPNGSPAPVEPETYAYAAPGSTAPLPIEAPEPFSILVWTREHLSLLLLTAWALIGSILAVRLFCTIHRVRQVVRATKAAPERIRRAMEKVAADLQCRARVEVRVTSDLRSPFLAGAIPPVLVLPERMTDEQHAGELPAVFAHELAHVRTHDLIWTLAGKWLSVLLWFHPLIWTVRAAHATACEQVCDAVAAEYVGGSPTYSQTLARAALELVVDAPALAGIPMIRSADITRRLRNLKRGIKAAALARPWVAATVVVGCVTLTALGCLKFVCSEAAQTGESRAASEQALEAKRYTFGPVIERWINDDDAGKDFSIDFDTGRLWDQYPVRLAGGMVPKAEAWGIDAFADVSGKPKNIICSDMIVIAADNAWDGDPAAIVEELERGSPGSPVYMSVEGDLPKSYIFKTHGGIMLGRFDIQHVQRTGMAVVQILELADRTEPRGVRIRYKMIQRRVDSLPGRAVDWPVDRSISEPTPPPKRHSFGPAIEQWVNDDDAGKDFSIDFDRGRLWDMYPLGSTKGVPTSSDALDIDAFVDVSGKPKNIVCFAMVVMAADHVWDGDPDAIVEQLERARAGLPVYMSAEGELPKSFIFKTYEDGMGVLQILDLSDRIEPRGVRIRYKLIREQVATVGAQAD